MSPDINVKLLKERNRFERPVPLQAIPDTMRWRARCMHVGCPWFTNELADGEVIECAAQVHADSTGHPVKLRVTVEFDAGVIRSQHGGR